MNITMSFDYLPNGLVKIVCTPPGNELIAKMKGGHKLTNAESMAIICILKLMAESMNEEKKSNIIQLNT